MPLRQLKLAPVPLRPDQTLQAIGATEHVFIGRVVSAWAYLENCLGELLLKCTGMSFEDGRLFTARMTGSFMAILVASRDYLEARGTPKSIADLHQHNCIGLRLGKSGPIYDWELMDGKKQVPVKTSGTALLTDTTQVLNLAVAGVGIAYVVEPLARQCLRDGSLKWLLPQTAVEYDGLFLYYPRRASLAPKLRAFIDVAKQTLRSIA